LLCKPAILMEPTVTLLGIGNILMMDEGVGVHVVNAVAARCLVPPELEIVDGGTSGLDLLPYIEGRDKLLIVDAVDFGKAPGFIGMLENEAIPAMLEGQTKVSLHHLGLLDVLGAARLLDALPREVCLLGIQPQVVEVGLEMTPLIQEKMSILIEQVLARLAAWGIDCPPLQNQEKSAK
jgi:hydrogenase maturation protease